MDRRLVTLLLLVLAGAPAGAAASSPPWVVTAKSGLAALPTHAAASMAGYSREAFGPAWADVDHNGCNTRDDVLRRDLAQVVLKAHSRCVVVRGVLHDPYTGRTIHFVRGPGTSSAVQIDHVVALADAWRTGAARWGAARRLAYANDPFVLLAVEGRANDEKADADASEWLPAKHRCAYVARQVAVKQRYRLWVTSTERAALKATLAHC
jgi:hypothetical protein